MGTILKLIWLLAFLSIAYPGNSEDSVVGTYHSIGTHSWTLKIGVEGDFTAFYSDAGGFHEFDGLWKKRENRVFLLMRENGKLEVFRILTLSSSGPAKMTSPQPTVIELDSFDSIPNSRSKQIEIIEPEQDFYKEEDSNQAAHTTPASAPR